jgi:hypothetical protein
MADENNTFLSAEKNILRRDNEDAYNAGINIFLQKPFTETMIKETLFKFSN